MKKLNKVINTAKKLINLPYNKFNLDNYYSILQDNLDSDFITPIKTIDKLPIKLMSGNHSQSQIIKYCNHNNKNRSNVYIVGKGIENNVLSNSLQKVKEVSYNNDISTLDSTLFNSTKQSLSVNNLESAVGGRGAEDLEQIRQNALASFATQNRSVTKTDYMFRALNMPQKFGVVSKAYIQKSENGNTNGNDLDLNNNKQFPQASRQEGVQHLPLKRKVLDTFPSAFPIFRFPAFLSRINFRLVQKC